MNDRIRDLVARITTDEEFKQRVRERGERARNKRLKINRRSANRYRHQHPERESARKAVTWAVKRGELYKPSKCLMHEPTQCVGRLEAHHWHGYDESHWLDVVWLCHRHHQLVESAALPLPHFAQ